MGLFDFFTKFRSAGRIKEHCTPAEPESRASSKLEFRHDQSKIQERRNELRHTTYLSTIVKQGDKDSFGTIINFSQAGFGILVGREFKEDDVFDITLSMNNEAPLSVQLSVQSCLKVDGEYFIGAKVAKFCPLHANFFKSLTQTVKPEKTEKIA